MTLIQTGEAAQLVAIDGNTLYDFIISGAGNVILHERLLNRINVFPVPDGDTGTNLALTMRTVIAGAKRDIAVGSTMDSISRAAGENAYGNSGMIFAEYLHGFAEAVRQKERLTPQEFAASTEIAVSYAYKAVATPKEGTILTVMRAWTEELKRQLDTENLESWLARSVECAKAMVEQTRTMMKVLRDNNVVDSGAKGFLLFVEGMLAHVRHGGAAGTILAHEVSEDAMEMEPIPVNPPEHRYCSQFTLELEAGHSMEDVRAFLRDMGDSIVLTGDGNPVLRVHVHANQPEVVMSGLLRLGQVISHKVDDMALQQAIVHGKRNRVGIVTDSIADMPAKMLEEARVAVVPIHVIHDGTAYLDKVTMTPERFYEEIDTLAMNPTSAQPTSATLERVFGFMLGHYDEVVGIFVSDKMSGLYRNASRVAEKLSGNGRRIHIVNSKLNSAAEGLLVREAIRLANTDMGLDEMVEKLEATAARTRIYVSVESLRNMIKGGRVSKTQGAVLSALNLKPVVSIDSEGKGSVWAKTFTRKQALSKILRQIRKDMDAFSISAYGLVYADDPAPVVAFGKIIERHVGQAPVFVEPISSVVGLNAGRGAFAIAYMMERG